MRILVVDDDASQRTVLGRLARTFGCEIMEAADGAEALGVLARWPAALILTDLQMPRMSGLGMVQKLRESGDQTPVIMMSGLSDVGQSVALGAGVDVYLPKPVDPARLVAAIDRLLSPAASAHRIPA